MATDAVAKRPFRRPARVANNADKTTHIRRPPMKPSEAVLRVIARHAHRGDSDLKVAERIVTALRADSDPDVTNEAFDGLLWLLAIQDHRETRHKPTLRADYRPPKGKR